eukprot:gene31649-38249_t
MKKRVERKDVTVEVEVPTSPVKESNANVAASLSSLPKPDELRRKYGLPVAEQEEERESEVEVSLRRRNDELGSAVELLRGKVEEKNRKIEQLCQLLEALEPVPGMEPSKIQAALLGKDEAPDLRDAKIVSLAKKAHSLSMLLNKERSATDRLKKELDEEVQRSASLAQQLQALERERAAGANEKNVSYNRHALAKEREAQAKGAAEEETLGSLQRALKE